MIVAIHQPNYLPWWGYWHKLASADVFILLDDVQYEKGGYTNRVRIGGDGEPCWMTIPVSVHLGDTIQQVHPAHVEWPKQHLQMLAYRYRHAPFCNEVLEALQKWFRFIPEQAPIAVVNSYLIRRMVQQMRLHISLRVASSYHLQGLSGTARLIALVQAVDPQGTYLSGRGGAAYQDEAAFRRAGLDVQYTPNIEPVYDHDTAIFTPGLSLIDRVMYEGWEQTAIRLQPPHTAEAERDRREDR